MVSIFIEIFNVKVLYAIYPMVYIYQGNTVIILGPFLKFWSKDKSNTIYDTFLFVHYFKGF